MERNRSQGQQEKEIARTLISAYKMLLGKKVAQRDRELERQTLRSLASTRRTVIRR